MTEKPEGIITTVSRNMYAANGYRHWLRNFKDAMSKHDEGWMYFLRVGSKPTRADDIAYVYLCIGNEIRFRAYFGGVHETPEGYMTFADGRTLRGRLWLVVSGPLEIAPLPRIKRQGFQGFRYTHKLF